MKAILRTWNLATATFFDKMVDISENHDFSKGPYQDTIPFSVASNQEIIPID